MAHNLSENIAIMQAQPTPPSNLNDLIQAESLLVALPQTPAASPFQWHQAQCPRRLLIPPLQWNVTRTGLLPPDYRPLLSNQGLLPSLLLLNLRLLLSRHGAVACRTSAAVPMMATHLVTTTSSVIPLRSNHLKNDVA